MPSSTNTPKKRQHNLDVGRKTKSESAEPLSSEILEAQKMLEDLKRRKEEEAKAEERRVQIEERKNAFVDYHQEVVEKLTASLPTIETEVTERNNEVDDLVKAKKHFSATLNKLQSYKPSDWSENDVMELSNKYQEVLEKASGEHEQFLAYIGKRKAKKSKKVSVTSPKELVLPPLASDLMRGFAFSLPLIITLIVLCLTFGEGN